MKWRILHLFLMMFLVVCANAQDEPGRTKPPAPQSFITTIPVRCILRDYNIGYGHALDSYHTIEYRVGWVHRNNLLHEYYEGWFTSSEMRFHGPSVYVQWNKWDYTKSQKRWYWGIIGGYRYLWHHESGLWMGGMGGSSFAESLTISQWRNDLLALFTIGIQTTKISTIEFSVGARVSNTHTHVDDTRFHIVGQTPEEYEAYRKAQTSTVPYGTGFSILPVVRLSSRFGKFNW